LGAPARYRALCLDLPKRELERRVRSLNDQVIASSDDLIVAFASAAARSAPARGVPGVVIVRGGVFPGIAVVGALDPAAIARVEELLSHVDEAVMGLHYVSYERAERDVRLLAERLEERFSRGLLDSAEFRAIPRGGLIVLGMLALTMDLRPDQLQGPTDDARPLVLVDDCALSGHRLHHELQERGGTMVSIAVLYAPEELCRSIEARETHVQGCVAAHYLRDLGQEIHGAGYQAWVDRWTERLGEDRYWVGHPESVVFAWNEPDRSFINAATGQREAGWQLFGSGLAGRTTGIGGAMTVQVQPTARGPIRPTASVFFGDLDGSVVIAKSEHDSAIVLDPVASAIWRSLIEHGTVHEAVDGLLAAYDASRSRLEDDVRALVDDLRRRSILVDDGGPL
jgi:hypothetical protein